MNEHMTERQTQLCDEIGQRAIWIAMRIAQFRGGQREMKLSESELEDIDSALMNAETKLGCLED